MPVVKYKCEYCYSFYDSEEKVIIHEEKCQYVPGRKHCDTCTYKKYIGYPFGGPHICTNKSSPFYQKDIDDMNKEFDCEVWMED